MKSFALGIAFVLLVPACSSVPESDLLANYPDQESLLPSEVGTGFDGDDEQTLGEMVNTAAITIPRPAPGEELLMLAAVVDEPPHDYTIAFRPTLWLPMLDGDMKLATNTPIGTISDTVDFDDDLGFDSLYPTAAGEINLRLGRHDFWGSGFIFDVDERNTAKRSFDFGDITIPAQARIETKIEFDFARVTYGYSFFDLEDDGLRFGPTLTVGWFEFQASVEARDFSAQERVTESSPIPFLGLHLEVPSGDFLFALDVSGIWVPFDSFEGAAIDGTVVAYWRPIEWGAFFAGYRLIWAEGKDDGDDFEFDALLHGPFIGGEIRF